MLLMVSGSNIDWDSEIIDRIKAYGYEIRHYKVENKQTSFYFEQPSHLIDVVVMGSKDVVPYEALFEEISKILKKEKGIKIYTIQNDEAAKEAAIVDYCDEEILLRVELPKGTLYEGPAIIPVKVIMKNKASKPIEARIKRDLLFQVRVTDLNWNEMLLLGGDETKTEQTYEIKDKGSFIEDFTINVEDFKGNIMIIGLTQIFEYKGKPTFFQTAPIRITIK